MPIKAASSSDTSDREIVLTRIFSAPRELVFTVFTDPLHLPHWWGPRGFTITTHAIDVRPGGTWRFIMHGADGTNYDNKIVYREIEKPARLVYTHSDGNDGGPGSFVTTATFESIGEKTKVTLRAVFRSPEERDEVIKTHHAIEGGKQHLDRLGEHLAAVKNSDREIFSHRVIPAKREQIFAAFSDPKILAQWWGPKGFTNEFREFDFRPGGFWRFIMRGPDGQEFPNESKFIELAAPERIIFEHLHTMHWFRMTVHLLDHPDGGTEVTWRMRFASAEEVTPIRAYISEANQQNFDRLEAVLAQTK